MANVNTYAKLIKPPMFRPDESVTFRLEYSNDLTCSYGTLKVYGYGLGVNDNYYNGTKITHYMNTTISGQRYEDFVVPPNTLGENTNCEDVFLWSLNGGSMKAVVEVGNQLDGDGNVIPLFKSNVILVDMLMSVDDVSGTYNSLSFENSPYSSDSSTKSVSIIYRSHRCLGAYGNDEVNSYRFYLYDSDYSLIQDSGELYDWSTDAYANVFYTYHNLANNTTYYVKSKATLIGGYTLETDYASITVNYEETPIDSTHLILSNDKGRGRVKLKILNDATHTKAVISRSVYNANDWLELKTVTSSLSEITAYDYYAIAGVKYTYKVVIYNGTTAVATYYNNITHEFNGVCIADIFGGYCTLADLKKYPVNRNDRAAILEPMDSKYAYAIVNGAADYENGSVGGIFAPVTNDCKIEFNNNSAYTKQIRSWLNNTHTKLLKYYNGEAWLVSVSGVTSDDADNIDVLTTTFNWTEIGDVNDETSYLRLGLVIGE
jgi:hypothetical protein